MWVLNGLAQVPRLTIFRGIEVGDRSRHLQDPVMGARRCPCENPNPQFRMPDFIRSRLCFTALPGRPTTLKSVILAERTWTSTSTRCAPIR
jgi:hypothetical protein